MSKFASLVVAARRRRKGEDLEEEGFTLIELLVVLLIIGILLAIAIPTFLSVTKTAGDTAVQSNLQSALTNAKTLYLQNGNDSYAGLSTGWASVDSGLTQATGGATPDASYSTGPQVVSLDGTATEAVMVIYSNATNHCWGILDDTTTSGTAVLGVLATSFPATVYFEYKSATAGHDCQASQVDSNPAAMVNSGAALTSGWPPAS